MTDQFVCIECNAQGKGAGYAYEGYGPICKRCAFLRAEPVPALAPQQAQYEPLSEAGIANLAQYGNTFLQAGHTVEGLVLHRALATIRARDKEIAGLRGALAWYADEDNYKDIDTMYQDRGDNALEALEAKEAKGG